MTSVPPNGLLRIEIQHLKKRNAELLEALEKIGIGYSGTVGNCQGLSGTDCAEIARAALAKAQP